MATDDIVYRHNRDNSFDRSRTPVTSFTPMPGLSIMWSMTFRRQPEMHLEPIELGISELELLGQELMKLMKIFKHENEKADEAVDLMGWI